MRLAIALPRGRRRALILLLSLLVIAAACGGRTAHAATLTRGFADDVWFDPVTDNISPQQWITKTVATGAKLVQIEVDWVTVEPNAPAAGDNPTNPDGPQFNFSYLDQRVKQFVGTGLQPVFLLTDAPRWAEGPGGTATEYASGGYEPNARALGDLAEAMAKRYSGTYPDPANPGATLPRVRYYQAWAEANMEIHLSPQWTKTGRKFVNTGPVIYRNVLNAFYDGIKAGDSSDVVIASGLESYGDRPDVPPDRTPPVTFLDNLLCLNSKLTGRTCQNTTHFNVMASDAYDVGAPTLHAQSALDASAPDLGKLTQIVRAGVKQHTALPTATKPLWVTEFAYQSNPPNHTNDAVSTATQARWLQESFYVFANEGVSTVLWYLVRDQLPPYSTQYSSGVYFLNGTPKPSFTAYRFPFVVMPSGQKPHQQAQIWGITPVGGSVQVQHKAGGSWKTIARFSRGAGTIFSKTVASLPKGSYRAVVHGQNSLVWSY